MLLIRSDSPRVYVSTNPWKVTSTFQTVSSTREEYVALIGELKASAPTKPKSKVEFAHQNLILALEARLEAIDKESTVSFLQYIGRFFTLPVTLSYFFPSFVLLTPDFIGYSGHAERLSSAISFSLKLKSGKREHGDRLTGLITFTTMPKVTYVLGFELRLGCR